MSRFWSPLVHQLQPYVPGEQPRRSGLIKLNTNENPYPPSPQVLTAIQSALGEDAQSLRLYPDPESSALRQAAARLYGLAPEQVFLGNGSDEVLAFAFQGLMQREGPVAFPDISYSFYPVYCGLYEIDCLRIPLAEDFSFDLGQLPQGLGTLVFPNPNAPTGMAIPREQIEALLQARPDLLVLVDEAYVDFGTESCAPLVGRYDNLLVTQSFSKSRALAGMRLGMAFGQAGLIQALVRIKDSFNSYPIDRLASAAGVAALEDQAWLTANTEKIVQSRAWLSQALKDLGFAVLPSQANFVFARVPAGRDAADLAQALREANVLVRHFKTPRIQDFLRITVGTPDDCARLIELLRPLLAA